MYVVNRKVLKSLEFYCLEGKCVCEDEIWSLLDSILLSYNLISFHELCIKKSVIIQITFNLNIIIIITTLGIFKFYALIFLEH
jgi:hypothetical protein